VIAAATALAVVLASAQAAQPARPKPAPAKPASATAAPGAKPSGKAFETVAAAAAAARDAGRLDEALAQYRRALALKPDWPEGRWYLGSILYEKERYAEARDAFAALVASQPTHAGAFGLKGLCEFALGHPDTALRSLLKARNLGIARTPEIAQVVAYHAGVLLTKFGEYEVGYAVLTELSALNLESSRLIEALGLNVLRMPMLPAAVPAAKKPMVQLAGRAAFALGGRRLGEAGTLLDELVATYPKEPNVRYARGVLRMTENPDGALEDFEAELVNSPRHVPARLQIVFEWVKRGEAAKARRYAEDAIAIDPQHFATHLAMGQVWLETGEHAKAIASFERGAKLAPGSPQAQFLLARAYGRAGRTADAERARAAFRRLESVRASQPLERGAEATQSPPPP
jgi:tetratricopeptide (TPR) repeat protein